MKTMVILFGGWILSVGLFGQATEPSPPAVSVPLAQNRTCPIMGKPISSALFVDTDHGRIWVCCTPCNKKVLADLETAYKTAFPKSKRLDNPACPITGQAITKDSPRIQIQGLDFAVCCAECKKAALEDSQIVVAKLNNPQLQDLANRECPISGLPVAKNTFLVVEQQLVRLSSGDCVEWAAKDPKRVLEKVNEYKAKSAPKPPADPKKDGQ